MAVPPDHDRVNPDDLRLPVLTGRAWSFADRLPASDILPERFIGLSPDAAAAHLFADLDTTLAEEILPGDMLVAGQQLGAGASGPAAAKALAAAGFVAVVAGSFVAGFDEALLAAALPPLEVDAPAIFHTGHSGMGSGMRGGGGIHLKYGQPMLVDDVAVDFPDIKIILAHPSWPWVDESLSMALHKENVFIDLSGWSPKYFQPQIIQYANTQLKHKMLFGSDFPLILPDKWLSAARDAGFRDEVLPLIMKDNAARLLGLG